MAEMLTKIINRLKSINYFAIALFLCQVVILLMSSCTVYKKQLHNRFAIGTGLYETRVRVHYRDITLCTVMLILHMLSHLVTRTGHLPSVPYSLFLTHALYSRYLPFVLQCFSILKNDAHLKHLVYFKLTTLLYVLFGCVQCCVVVNELVTIYNEWKPALSAFRAKKAVKLN